MMNLPFNVKFTIFNENKPMTKKQQQLKENLIQNELKNIIMETFSDDENFKFLDRCEASVCSIDENKQLRLQFDDMNNLNKKQPSFHFHQQHSQCKIFLTMEELKYVSNKIKDGLEKFLCYEIDDPIIYININNL